MAVGPGDNLGRPIPNRHGRGRARVIGRRNIQEEC